MEVRHLREWERERERERERKRYFAEGERVRDFFGIPCGGVGLKQTHKKARAL